MKKARASGLFAEIFQIANHVLSFLMTRTEAITIITTKLASLDDDKLLAVADIVQSIDNERRQVRQLSARERGLLVQSKSDFSAGRKYSHEQLTALLDARLGRLGVPKSTT